MKKFLLLITTVILFCVLSACASNESTPNTSSETNKVKTIVAETLSAIPTVTLTSTPPTITPVPSTDTPVQTLAPLYSEVTWENLGQSEQEISLNGQTSERTTLAGYNYQASLPPNDNVYTYYSNENMKNMGWLFVGGWGETAEFYNESGYFLTLRFSHKQGSIITIWISDQTTIIPVVMEN